MDGNGLYTDHLRGDTVERGHRCDKRGNGSSLVLGATKKKWREGVSMYNKKEEAMREEARAAIIETLRNGYTGYYCDLHNEIFNTDYYIIGTYEAKEALKEYDVFKAIEKVRKYEEDNFGEIYTDLSDPEKLINMLYYIIGEEVLYELMEGVDTFHDNWNNQADEETNAEILAEILIEILKKQG